MQTRSPGPTSALVLAFLMVFTVLVNISPQAESQAGGPNSPNCLQIGTYPEFAFNTNLPTPGTTYAHPATRSGEYNQRAVRIANTCGADINEIRFMFYVRDGATPCSGTATDPCFDDTSVTWDADHSFARGWSVVEDNRAKESAQTQMANNNGRVANPTIRELIFHATSTLPLRIGTATCGNRVVYDGGTTANSPTITSLTANFVAPSGNNPGDVGKPVTGPGIPAGATILGPPAPMTLTSATLSVAATVTATNVALDIGAAAPCSTTSLSDNVGNFDNIGVQTGDVLNILNGAAVGRYTVTGVTNTAVTFYPPSVASVRTPYSYSIVRPNALNATLLPGAAGLTTQAGTQKAQDFTIAFKIKGGSNAGTQIPIGIVGYRAQYPSSATPPTPFETSCQARASNGYRCLLPLDPANCPCPPGLQAQAGQYPSLYIIMDDGTVAPTASGLGPTTAMFDMDHNGHIERIDVNFTKRLDPLTFNAVMTDHLNDGITNPGFKIVSRARAPYAPYDRYTINSYLLTDQKIPGLEWTVATFYVNEQPYYDTGGPGAPGISYIAPSSSCVAQAPPSCGIRDLAGNTMRSFQNMLVADRAQPVMVGSYGREGSDKLDVFFSEPVVGTGTAGVLRINDLQIFEGGGSLLPTSRPCNAIHSMADFQTDSIADGAGDIPDNPSTRNLPASGWHYTFTTKPDPLSQGANILMGACDVHPMKGDSLQPSLTGVSPNQVSSIVDLASPALPLYFLNYPYVRSAATSGSTSTLRDTSVNFNTAGVTPGMRVRVTSGGATGEYGITAVNLAGDTLTFAPNAPTAVTVGSTYWVFQYVNTTWPSGAVEVRTSGFGHHITYPLVQRVDMDIQAGMAPSSVTGYTPKSFCRSDSSASCVLRVQFNGPVHYARNPSVNRTDTGVTISDMDVASTSGTGQGPQGFVQGLFTAPDVDTILLLTDFPARPQDVDNTPAYFKVHCDRIQGTHLQGTGPVGTSSFVPCDDPDRFYGWDEDPANAILHQDAAVIDVTAPKIYKARTVDSNHDGYIDGVELTFTEPVNDNSYCQTQAIEPNYCADSAAAHPGGMITFHDPWSPNYSQWETTSQPYWDVSPNGGFRWDTGATHNDNVGILQLVNSTIEQGSNAIITRTRNFQTDYAQGGEPNFVSGGVAEFWKNGLSVFHKQLLPSDYVPHLTLRVPGLVTDMAQQPVAAIGTNNLPEYCQGFRQSEFPSWLTTLNINGAESCDINKKVVETVTVLDGAPPVVWRAATVDTPFYDANHCTLREACHTAHLSDPLYKIQYGNGTIDGYKLTFSEPVVDGSFCKKDWTVETPADAPAWVKAAGADKWARLHEVVGFRTIEPNDVHTNRVNDNEMTILFNETAVVTSRFNKTISGKQVPFATFAPSTDGKWPRQVVPDTGSRPELTYSPTCGVTDAVKNVLPTIDPISVTEQDGAAPVMLSASGFLGKAFLLAKFSEPVDDGSRGALVRDDFNYYDIDNRGVAGKSSSQEVCHGDSDYILPIAGCDPQPLDEALIPLTDPGLTGGDIASDRLAAVVGKVREIAPSVPVFLRQSVPDEKIPLGRASDSSAPGAIRDLRVEDAKTDAGSVTLSWTAPGNDGLGGGPVFAYRVAVSNKTAITDILTVFNPPSTILNYTPALSGNPGPADANHTQTVRIEGLQQDTIYYFAVQAIDQNNNAGPAAYACPGTPCSTHTTKDLTPPDCMDTPTKVGTCPLVIDSSDCGGGAMSTLAGNFKWTAARDLQSPNSLQYRWKFSHEELDRVLATDTLEKGTSTMVTFPSNGTWYVHVSAFSPGGYTPPAHFKCVVGAGIISTADLVKANDAVDTHPVRIQVGDVYVNDVRWTLPPKSSLPAGSTVVGVEIWRKDGNTFVLVNPRIDGTYDQLATGNWTDNTVGAGPDSQYRVQMVFAGNPEQSQADPQSGYHALEDQTPQGIPSWAWILIGIGLALLVAGIVIFFVLRGKQAESQGAVPYAWESANPDQIGIDEATGMPVHEVRCPSCNNPFQAIGNLPLPVTCPNCGTTGTLD